ncbi:MAG: MFS transporter [Planctomycetota bacterium]|mgnify:CR=1 FL=1
MNPNRSLASWVLYDFANTIFSMNIVTLTFSLWVTLNNGKSDLWVGAANVAAAILVLLTMPLLGVWSDAYSRKRSYLRAATVACCALTALMGVVATAETGGRVLAATACFVLASFAYHAGMVFYNSLLTSVTPEATMGRVSGFGVAAGYAGAIVGVILVMPFESGKLASVPIPCLSQPWEPVAVISARDGSLRDGPVDPDVNLEYEVNGLAPQGKLKARDVFDATAQKRFYELSWNDAVPGSEVRRRESGWGRAGIFVPTAILYLLFALPCLIWVREKPRPAGEPVGVLQAYSQVLKSLRATREHPGVLRFLIGKYFYEDAVSTVTIFMAVYGAKVLKFSDESVRYFLLTAIASALAGSLATGFLTDRWGPKRTLLAVLVGWIVFLALSAVATDARAYWILGPGLGLLLGALWTSSRPLLVTLVPRARQGEFFALSELTGKTSAVIGPILWGGIILAAAALGCSEVNQYRLAIGSLVVMMVIGFWILRSVPDVKVGQVQADVAETAADTANSSIPCDNRKV